MAGNSTSFNPLQPGTQTQNTTGSNTYDPNVIAGSNTAQGLATQAAQTPFTSLPADQAVAGMSGNQQLSYDSAARGAGLIDQNNATLGQDWRNPGTQQSYMNPYETQVLDAQKARATQSYGAETAALDTKAGMNNSFGGSGSAIEHAQNTQNYNLNLQNMDATGLSGAYTAGEQQFNTAQNLALSSNAAERGALDQTGGVAQQIAQNKDTYTAQQFALQRDWEMNQAKNLAGVMSNIPKNSTSTRDVTQTNNASGMSNLAGVAGLAEMGMGLYKMGSSGGGGGGGVGGTAGGTGNTTQYASGPSVPLTNPDGSASNGPVDQNGMSTGSPAIATDGSSGQPILPTVGTDSTNFTSPSPSGMQGGGGALADTSVNYDTSGGAYTAGGYDSSGMYVG